MSLLTKKHLALVCLLLAVHTSIDAFVIERIVSDSTDLFSGSTGLSFSDDGRFVVFTTRVDSLVPGDTNDEPDVFVHDRTTGITERVSLDYLGNQADWDSINPDVNQDGRFIVFESFADLVPEDTNGVYDIYLRDRLLSITERISVGHQGQQGFFDSFSPSISSDGRYVTFRSGASNFVPNDANGARDIFLRDRLLGTTKLISVNNQGEQANANSLIPSISGNGRFIGFTSEASNLVDNDVNGELDVFVYDQTDQSIRIISVMPDGTQGDDSSVGPFISFDGRYYAFVSRSSNFIGVEPPPGILSTSNIFLVDSLMNTFLPITQESIGNPILDSSLSAISPDGSAVIFVSRSPNIVPNDENNSNDIFKYDIDQNKIRLMSVNQQLEQGNDQSGFAATNFRGDLVAFFSFADNLVLNDKNDRADIFIAEDIFIFDDGFEN